jgi:hypothetical protein
MIGNLRMRRLMQVRGFVTQNIVCRIESKNQIQKIVNK